MNGRGKIVPAALLLHGFGGTPFEMQGLAEVLARAGCAVETPLLPGHGENLQAFSRTCYAEWLTAAEQAYLKLLHEHGKVMAAGLSMGGSLALDLARRHKPAGVMCISTPVFLYRFYPWTATDWRLPFVPLIKRFRPVWPCAPSKPECREIAPWQGYEEGIALEPLDSFMLGLKSAPRTFRNHRAAFEPACPRR